MKEQIKEKLQTAVDEGSMVEVFSAMDNVVASYFDEIWIYDNAEDGQDPLSPGNLIYKWNMRESWGVYDDNQNFNAWWCTCMTDLQASLLDRVKIQKYIDSKFTNITPASNFALLTM